MAWFRQWQKARAVRIYLRRCPDLLKARYGADTEYSPARILTTLRVHGITSEFADYACAMFSGLEQYVSWMQSAPAGVDRERTVQHPYREPGAWIGISGRDECIARYTALRREVAGAYNGGSERFIPEPEPPLDQWVPLSNERAIGPLAWLL